MRAHLPLALLALVGCGTPEYAVVGGKRVTRPTLGYSDGFRFAIEHTRAFPDVLTSAHAGDVEDGRIQGRVCGLDVDFDAAWHGRRVELTGRADVPWHREFTQTGGLFGLSLDITELSPGRRRIVGRVAGAEVDIDASPERLTAQINGRHYELTADGEFLGGRMHDVRSLHTGEPPRAVDSAFNIYGRQALATMVPADEAVVLVLMLACNDVTIERHGETVPGFSLVRLPTPE